MFKDGKLVIHIVFADKDAVRDHMAKTYEFFRQEGFNKIASSSDQNHITLEKGITRLVLFNGDKQKYDIRQHLKEGVFGYFGRMHANNEDLFLQTEEVIPAKDKLFFLSSCRSVNVMEKFAEYYPGAEFIGANETAYGDEANKLTKAYIDSFLKRIPTYEDIRENIRANGDFRNYVLPGGPEDKVRNIMLNSKEQSAGSPVGIGSSPLQMTQENIDNIKGWSVRVVEPKWVNMEKGEVDIAIDAAPDDMSSDVKKGKMVLKIRPNDVKNNVELVIHPKQGGEVILQPENPYFKGVFEAVSSHLPVRLLMADLSKEHLSIEKALSDYKFAGTLNAILQKNKDQVTELLNVSIKQLEYVEHRFPEAVPMYKDIFRLLLKEVNESGLPTMKTNKDFYTWLYGIKSINDYLGRYTFEDKQQILRQTVSHIMQADYAMAMKSAGSPMDVNTASSAIGSVIGKLTNLFARKNTIPDSQVDWIKDLKRLKQIPEINTSEEMSMGLDLTETLLKNSSISDLVEQFGVKPFIDILISSAGNVSGVRFIMPKFRLNMLTDKIPGFIGWGTENTNLDEGFKEYQRLRDAELLMQKTRQQIEPLVSALEPIKDLIKDGVIDMRQIQQVMDLSGGSISAASRSLSDLSEVIKTNGLEDLIELVNINQNPNMLRIKWGLGPDEFGWLSEYRDLLLKYGTKPFIFMAGILKKDHVFSSKDKSSENILEFAKELEEDNIIDTYGIEVACAVLLKEKEIYIKGLYPNNPIIEKKDWEFLNSAAHYLRLLKEKNARSLEDWSRMSEGLIIKEDIDAFITYYQLFSEYGLENVAILSKSVRAGYIEGLFKRNRPIIQKVGIESLVELSKKDSNVLTRLADADMETWALLFLQQGKIGSGEKDLRQTVLHLNNLSVFYDMDQFGYKDKIMSALLQVLQHNKRYEKLNLVEDFLVTNLFRSREVQDKISDYLVKEKTDVKRALITRALFWKYAKLSDEKIHPFDSLHINDMYDQVILNTESKNLPQALNFIPTCSVLTDKGIITTTQFQFAAQSGDLINAIPKLLSTKIEEVFNLKLQKKHELAQNALTDTDFLVDLFNFHRAYISNSNASEVLKRLVKVYFEEGPEGVMRYKASQELSNQQAPEQIISKFMELSQLAATVREGEESELNIFEQLFKTTLDSYERHMQENKFDIKGLAIDNQEDIHRLEASIKGFLSQAKDVALRDALSSNEPDKLLTLKLFGKDEKIRNQAIGIFKRINLMRQEADLGQAIKIAEQIRGTEKLPNEEQKDMIGKLAESNQERIPKLMPVMRMIHQQLIEKDKPEAQIIAELIGTLQALNDFPNYLNSLSANMITAEVSFDLKDTLKIGRFGASGQGNCQSSTNTGNYNKSLMSFIGDSHELIIILRDSSKDVIGFALLHGVYLDDMEFAYVKESVYTNDNTQTALQEEASKKIARQIANLLQVKILEANPQEGKDFTVTIPESYVPRYLDSLGGAVQPLKIQRDIKATIIEPASSNLIKQSSGSPMDLKGGIDLSKIELTLKDEKYMSSLSPADVKVLRAAKALKDQWDSLSLLYVHEIMLMMKDGLVKDLQNKNVLLNVMDQLKSRSFLDPQAMQFFNLILLEKSPSEIKLALSN